MRLMIVWSRKSNRLIFQVQVRFGFFPVQIFPVQIRFQISVQFWLRFKYMETLCFGFAPVKNVSKLVYKAPVQVCSKNGIILVTQFKK